MRSDLRSLRERIRRVEAGGHRDTPPQGVQPQAPRTPDPTRGGGLPNEDEFNALKTKFSTLDTKFGTLDEKVNTLQHLDDEVSTLKTQFETLGDLLQLKAQFDALRDELQNLLDLPDKFDDLVNKVHPLENKVKAKTTKSDSTASNAIAHKPSPQAVEDFEKFALETFPKQYRSKSRRGMYRISAKAGRRAKNISRKHGDEHTAYCCQALGSKAWHNIVYA